jgi:hypothetical protein
MRRTVAGWALGAVALMVSASVAQAGCPCPKQNLAEMYGSVSAIVPKTSPRLQPPAMTAEEIALRRVARGDMPVRLPLHTPASDQMVDLLQVELAAAD